PIKHNHSSLSLFAKLSTLLCFSIGKPSNQQSENPQMASGSSSGRPGSGTKGFDFASDDILCSYDDFPNQESSNGNHSDPIPSSSPSKQGFEKSRMSRSTGYQPASYGQPDDSFHQEVISTVERTMKRHSDNMMRFLEGISSRLSQLELYCYNLDKSIGEMRSDLTRDHTETDTKLKAVEKHLQEVHRSVQILRDKQELAETQKELAKLQKDSSSSNHSQSNEEKAVPPPAADPKNNDEGHNQQLALALPPQQVVPQQQQISVPPPSQTPPQNVAQPPPQTYYMPPSQSQPPHSQYMPPDSQYRSNQVPQAPAQATQSSQQYPQYQQQWSQQVQVPQTQHPSMQGGQVRPSSSPVYPPYPPIGAAPQDPTSYSPAPQPLTSRADTVPYGYGPTRPVPQQMKVPVPYGPQPGDGFLPPGSGYMVYDSERGGGIAPHPHHPTHPTHQTQTPHFSQAGNMMARNSGQPQFARNHPYNELVEKLVNMGFRGDHVMSVIQRMEETGQAVDFNAVLDRLNVQSSSGSPQRGWSG
ncbi:hypothetical protein LINPERPRIM_LOCUS42487, partial [Linum perenne]